MEEKVILYGQGFLCVLCGENFMKTDHGGHGDTGEHSARTSPVVNHSLLVHQVIEPLLSVGLYREVSKRLRVFIVSEI